MKIISDLTRDTRPKFEDLLEDAIKDVAKVDLHKPTVNSEILEYENKTFYYRVILLFIQRASTYYTEEEIEIWCKTEILEEVVLPKVIGYGLFDLKKEEN